MQVSSFDYDLPERLIAQEPASRRDSSRLLIVDRATGELADSVFAQLPEHLQAGDLLVLNNTRVFPARLIGRRLRVTPRGATILGGRVEVFLVSRLEPLVWEALVRPGRALLPGARVEFARGKLTAEVLEWRESGRRIVRFETDGEFDEIVDGQKQSGHGRWLRSSSAGDAGRPPGAPRTRRTSARIRTPEGRA